MGRARQIITILVVGRGGIPLLRPLGGVHFVDGDDKLSDTKGERKESVFTGLTILGDTGFKFTGSGGNDEDGTIGLGSTGDHVLNEITMPRGIDDGDLVLRSLELPQL